MSGVFAVENATVTLIAGGGFTEDHARPAGADAEKWSGEVGVHVVEKIVEDVSGGSLNQVKQTHLLLPTSVGVTPELGDTITYQEEDADPVTRDVKQVEDHSQLGFIRLRFWDV